MKHRILTAGTEMLGDDLSAGAVQAGLRTRYVGREYVHLPLTDSTQNVAAEAAHRGAPEGLVVLAEEQSAGRGRFQRRWVSPPGASLSVSILLRPPEAILPHIVMVGGLAAARAIAAIAPDLSPTLKWPNDVQLNGRKVCGILVETAHSPAGGLLYTILGLGMNVNWDPSQVPEIAATATSLLRERGRPASRRALLQCLLEETEGLYEEAKRDRGAVYAAWRSRLVTLGHRVRVRGGDLSAEGIAEDVDPSGALLIRTDDRRLVSVHAGDVTLAS
ncbi:MAG: biotin--[acetyl-CoA-carboxylase] ligase [Chloroflexi bacterium]|nr:biotin--[acetyl-CoA-carboxylase] ligase [Chloroflexota bacterium]